MLTVSLFFVSTLAFSTLLESGVSFTLPLPPEAGPFLDSSSPTSQYARWEDAAAARTQGLEGRAESTAVDEPRFALYMYAGLRIPPHHLGRLNSPLPPSEPRPHLEFEPLPLEWDSRTHQAFEGCWSSLAHVSDQGNCGASWALVASQSYRDAQCLAEAVAPAGTDVDIAGKDTVMANETQVLSALDTLTCAPASAEAFGCGGAVLTAGFEYFKSSGVCSEGCKKYPWSGRDGPGRNEKDTPVCKTLCDKEGDQGNVGSGGMRLVEEVGGDVGGVAVPVGHERAVEAGRHARYKAERKRNVLSDYATLGWDGEENADVDDIKKQIMKSGSVATELAIYPSFTSYKYGIYAASGIPIAGSAVRLVGWGTSEPGACWWEDLEGSRHEASQVPGASCDFWIAIATLGTSFGEGGSFRVLQGQALVGSAVVFRDGPSSAVPAADRATAVVHNHSDAVVWRTPNFRKFGVAFVPGILFLRDVAWFRNGRGGGNPPRPFY